MKSLVMVLTMGAAAACAMGELPDASWRALPRWRGFNLLEKFHAGSKDRDRAFIEDDFKWIAEWGFNFVRLPMDYRTWIVDGDPRKFNEQTLAEIDQAVAWGRQYGVHVMINFHRAPGYTVANPPEPTSVWTDEATLELCALHWATFARRYKGIARRALSFNLFNEPNNSVTAQQYVKVVRRLCQAIRAEDPQRLIVCDGTGWGRQPVEALVALQVAQATRGYEPFRLTHYKAGWVNGADKWPLPTYTAGVRENLWAENVAPWQAFAQKNQVGVMVGEFGAYNKTPHAVTLRWMEDCLANWKQAQMGWALWNFRGAFGILDSGRSDVQYEEFRGHKLDRAMLELLQRY